jgi:hypothetical protein
VLTELESRYDRGAVPTWLDPLADGSRPRTHADVVAAANKLWNEHFIAKTMDDATYASQGALLRNYGLMLPASQGGVPPRGATPAAGARPAATPATAAAPAPAAPAAAPAAPARAPAAAPAPAAPAPAAPAPAAPAPAAPAVIPAAVRVPAPGGAPVVVQAHETAPPPPPRGAGPPPPPPQLDPSTVAESAVANLPLPMNGKRPRSVRELQAAQRGLEILKNSQAINDAKYAAESAKLDQYVDVIAPPEAPVKAKTPALEELPAMWNGKRPGNAHDVQQAEENLGMARSAYGEAVYAQQRDLLEDYRKGLGLDKKPAPPEAPPTPPAIVLPPLYGKQIRTKKDLEDARDEFGRRVRAGTISAQEQLQQGELLQQYEAQIEGGQ